MILDEIAPFKICVNLPHRKDRRDEAWAQFAKLGMSVLRFPAIPSHRVKSTWGYKSPSRYACSLSKRLAIRTGKLAGASAVLLMEDDVVLADDLHERLAEIEVPEDWGILFLGCKHLTRPSIVAKGLVRCSRAADHHAMIVRSTYATQVIKGLSGTGKMAMASIPYSDVKMSSIQEVIPTYACYPNLAWQKYSHSDNANRELTHYNAVGKQMTDLHAVADLDHEMTRFSCESVKLQEIPTLIPLLGEAVDETILEEAPLKRANAIHRKTVFPAWSFLKSMPLTSEFGQQFPLAFYINLATREDRRVEAEFQFALQGMQVERMPAIIGKHVRNTRGHGNKSQYACRLSHRMAIRQAKARKAPCVLIFEDDVVLHLFFRDILERLTPPKDWGVLFFGCTHVKAPDVIEPGWVKVNYLWGLQAYVIKAEWYDKILFALNRQGSDMRQVGADIILSDLANEIPMYATYPNIAWQSEGYSDLMKTERQPFTKDGQQNRMLHVIRDLNEVMRHKIACEYGDDVVDEKKHHFLQPRDVYTAGEPVWSWEETFPIRLCINLEERIDRREQATMQFAKAQMDFSFFPAIDGRKKQKIVDPGAYGCAMSHILALRQAWQSGAEAVFITEDDVVLHKNLKIWAESCRLPDDWGILYLGNQHMLAPTVEARGLVRIHGSQSTHAYGVKRAYIPQIIKAMRIGLKTCRPCDMVLVDLHQIIPAYGFYPNLAWQRESFSNITGKTARSFESDGVQCWQRDSITQLDKSMRERNAK
jgi:GR25 family glycosyltransferase involved in LPS biosynthesis